MHSTYAVPDQLRYFSNLTIDVTTPVVNLSTVERLQAIAFADFRAIYVAVTLGYPLSAKQAVAIKRIRYDKSGQLIELSIKNRVRALGLLAKTMGLS